MKALDAVYYQFYLFYKNKLKQDDPAFFATIAISGLCIFIVMGIVCNITILLFDKTYKWPVYALAIGIFVLFYKHYNLSGLWKKIIAEKPYVRSEKFSRRMALLFFLIGMLFLFVSPMIGRYIRLGSMF